jgi:hypothetical protein
VGIVANAPNPQPHRWNYQMTTMTELDERAQQQQTAFLDRYISSNASLWNCLFTAHGGTCALTTLLLGLTARTSSPMVWVPAVVSAMTTALGCYLILKCFELERAHYRDLHLLGNSPPDSDYDMKTKMNAMDILTADRNRNIISYEKCSKYLLGLNSLAVLALVIVISFA